MEIILTVKNKNFDIALTYVQKRYPHLFHSRLQSIELLNINAGWLGLHCNFDGESKIKIKNGQYKIQEFIETLVHELVHVWQYVDNRERKESEANAISYEAYKIYLQETGQEIWK